MKFDLNIRIFQPIHHHRHIIRLEEACNMMVIGAIEERFCYQFVVVPAHLLRVLAMIPVQSDIYKKTLVNRNVVIQIKKDKTGI
jgi:hypothetical protein